MNATIARIVELAFASAAPTQEMEELKEEVLANCQAHYEDLIAQGKTPDEATEAVVQSLKGIEELVRSGQPAQPDFGSEAFEKSPFSGAMPFSFDPAQIRQIRMELTSADVDVLRGSRFDMNLKNGDRSRIECAMEGTTLVLRQVKQQASQPARQGLLQWLQFSFLPDDECHVELVLPEDLSPDAVVTTRSGDIHWETAAGNLELHTTSGDIELELPKTACPGRVLLATTNGDLDANGSASVWQLQTVNGDVDANIHGERLTCSATNGDLTVTGALRQASLSTVSGDQELTLEDPTCTQVRMKAVSGDLELTLPEGLRTIALHAHTVSGDVSLNGVTNDPAAPCSVQMDSVSGDLSVE